MKRFALAVGIALALMASAAPAISDNTKVDVAVQSQPDSPVAILKCSMVYYNTVTMISGTPTHTVSALTAVSFKNTTAQPVTAVKFGFAFKDDFGTAEFTGYGENSGLYSPNVEIDPNFALNGTPRLGSPGVFDVTFPATGVGEMGCFVAAVRYQDGTIWKMPPTGITANGNR